MSDEGQIMSPEEYEQYRKENSPFWSPSKEGESITGKFLHLVKGTYKGKETCCGVLELPSGKVKNLPSSWRLTNKLTQDMLSKLITITFVSEEDTGGPQKAKIYTVRLA